MSVVLATAGVVLWALALAVTVQRQRVLARRITRLEARAGLRRRRPAARHVQEMADR